MLGEFLAEGITEVVSWVGGDDEDAVSDRGELD